VYKGIYRTVGKRSKLYRHSLMAPGKQGPADFDSVKQQRVGDLRGSVHKGIYRTVGKRSKLYRHSLRAPGKQGPEATEKVGDLCGSVYLCAEAHTGL
jgi:hypothetical protein